VTPEVAFLTAYSTLPGRCMLRDGRSRLEAGVEQPFINVAFPGKGVFRLLLSFFT